MIADYMPKDYNPYYAFEGQGMDAGKKTVLMGGIVGFGIWAAIGFSIGGWTGAAYALGIIGLIACVGHTFGSVWRYFSTSATEATDRVNSLQAGQHDSLSISAALDAFREDTKRNPFGPPSANEATARILSAWLIEHGYLGEQSQQRGMEMR